MTLQTRIAELQRALAAVSRASRKPTARAKARPERVCAKHYAPWVRERQERLEEDVRRTFKAKVVPMRKRAG